MFKSLKLFGYTFFVMITKNKKFKQGNKMNPSEFFDNLYRLTTKDFLNIKN